MGLFDYVRCKVPLPDGYKGELQTKEFDEPYMETYTIEENGRLLKERVWYDNGSGNERHDMFYHGWLHFGGLETVGYEPDKAWPTGQRPIYKDHSYAAKFTDGQLVAIHLRTESQPDTHKTPEVTHDAKNPGAP